MVPESTRLAGAKEAGLQGGRERARQVSSVVHRLARDRAHRGQGYRQGRLNLGGRRQNVKGYTDKCGSGLEEDGPQRQPLM